MGTFNQMIFEYKNLKLNIKRLIFKQEELKGIIYFPSSTSIDGLPKGSGSGLKKEIIISKLHSLQADQENMENRLEIKREEITNAIDLLNNIFSKEVIELKIFLDFSWKDIANKLKYSYSRVRQIFYQGVNEIDKKLKENK